MTAVVTTEQASLATWTDRLTQWRVFEVTDPESAGTAREVQVAAHDRLKALKSMETELNQEAKKQIETTRAMLAPHIAVATEIKALAKSKLDAYIARQQADALRARQQAAAEADRLRSAPDPLEAVQASLALRAQTALASQLARSAAEIPTQTRWVARVIDPCRYWHWVAEHPEVWDTVQIPQGALDKLARAQRVTGPLEGVPGVDCCAIESAVTR